MKRTFRFFLLLLVLVLSAAPALAGPTSYDASTMRLLRHEGTVEIFDVEGAPRFLLDNVRFISGESMRTGGDGQASVGLDDTKIVSLDKDTRVEFIQESGHMQLNLLEGSIFLDVQEKLDENASFDIQTTTMTVGIRGTMIVASEIPVADGNPAQTSIGILEGDGRVSFQDSSGAKRVVDLSAGNKITVPKDTPGEEGVAPVVSQMTSADVPDYAVQQILADQTLTNRVVNGSVNGEQILYGSPENVEEEKEEYFPADGDWVLSGRITIVAQSASKLYDGKPLMRPSDALVYGLPGNFSIQVSCSGSITNVGSCDNIVSSYAIYNGSGENVTSHFPNVDKIPGALIVDPVTLVVWTGSAEKVYDGEPLICEEAGIRTAPGYRSEAPAWANTSLVTETALGSEKMIALSGHTLVHGTNPLTGQTQQLELKAGQSLSVCLHDGDDGQSIEFEIIKLREDELPEEVLRVYADNPDLLAQACIDAEWDPDLMSALIAALPPAEEKKVISETGLAVSSDARDSLMTDSTNVRIHIDSEITNYSTRALTEEEASFTPIVLDPSIVVTATGSQTEVGESYNTYTIDWGNANPKNFVLREDLGTLVVTAQNDTEITITAPSASKVYDGTPLTADGHTIVSGLPQGYTARVNTDGSITKVGTAKNEVIYYRILNMEGEDVTAEFSNIQVKDGTLTVKALSMNIDCGGSTVAYSGASFDPEPVLTYTNGKHAGETVSAQRVIDTENGRALAGYLAAAGAAPRRNRAEDLPSLKYVFTLFTGDTVNLTLTGMGTDAGTYTLSGTVTSSIGNNIKSNLTGTNLVISPAEVTITSGSSEKVYDGEPLTNSDISVTGMPDGQSVTVTPTGTITEPGTADNTFTVDWGSLNQKNYAVTTVYGKLTVTKAEKADPVAVTISSGSAEKVYDGKPLTSSEVTVTGLPEGQSITVTPTGTITDVGTAKNTFTIDWGDLNPDDYTVTESVGTLTVTAATVSITSGSAEKVYDGAPLTSSEVTINGLPEGQSITVTPTGTITDVGTADNTFTVDWGELVSNNYTVTQTAGTLTVTPAAVSITSGSKEKVYDGTPLTCTDITVTGLPEGQEIIARPIGTLTDVGTVENTISLNWGDLNPDNYTVTQTAGTLTVSPLMLNVNLGGRTFEYLHMELLIASLSCNGTSVAGGIEETDTGYFYTFDLPTGDSVTISTSGFNMDAPVGTYHLSGKASFSGNASNYTVNYSGTSVTITKLPLTITTNNYSKTYDGLPGPENTAAAIIGDNWEGITVLEAGSDSADAGSHDNRASVSWGDANPDNYDISYNLGTISITPRDVTLTSADASKAYDGTPLTNNTVTVGGSGFVSGEGASYSFTGSQTDVGSSDNTFTYTLNEGTKASNYNIADPVFGTLEVTAGTMTVTAVDYNEPYDGASHSGGVASCSVTDGTTFLYSTDGGSSWSSTPPSITEVGTMDYIVKATNPNYSDATATGTLTVTSMSMTVTAVSYSGVYDGTTHNGGATPNITDGTMIMYSTDGGNTWTGYEPRITDVGVIDYKVKATNPNYSDATADGRLEVTRAEMSVAADNYSEIYDGGTHSGGGTPSVTINTILQYSTDGGSTWSYTAPSITDVGTVNYMVKTTNQNFYDATANGSLQVTPRSVTMTSANDSKPYDGTALQNHTVDVTGDGFVSGEGASYSFPDTSSQTEVGSCDNAFSYTLDSGTNAANYSITTVYGILTVE